MNNDLNDARRVQKIQINELEEHRNDEYESSRIYKGKMKAFHDKRILRKKFEHFQKVYLYDSRLHKHPGKFRTRRDGSYVVNQFDNGAIEIEDRKDGSILG